MLVNSTLTKDGSGGLLTNYKTISKRIKRISEIEKMEEDGLFEVLPKKK